MFFGMGFPLSLPSLGLITTRTLVLNTGYSATYDGSRTLVSSILRLVYARSLSAIQFHNTALT